MWFDNTKSAMKKLKVAYNNSLRRLLSLPTYNSASEMFAVLNIPSFRELLRKFAFSLLTRIASSMNSFMVNIYSSSVPMFSKIWGWWYSILTIYLFLFTFEIIGIWIRFFTSLYIYYFNLTY